ncbi:hypothetical protein OWR29_38930 [Actinoplanes sp. Pm04-4]|uniref:Lipoprotein n=1 Tax=Paractinoplanes pyxinae TaxID=2997416 RepID=A0ABT4BBW1_9ACTN|nr:hypothetical protein [Actinoplanes pyxinae]MCY1144005.1 hypothetical protein [Actinoplanes pyxinae]
MADRRAIFAAGALLLAVSACTGGNNDQDPSGRTTTVSPAAVRTDAEPITKRFPALGAPTDLHWQGAAAGADSGGVPGPTDVRIQALIVLTPDLVAAAQKDYQFQPATGAPDLTTQLQPFAPAAAAWRESDAFTQKVRTAKYSGTILLDPASRTLWLDVIGG